MKVEPSEGSVCFIDSVYQLEAFKYCNGAADEHSGSSFGCKTSPVNSVNLSTGIVLPGGNSDQLYFLTTEAVTANISQENFTLNPGGRIGAETRKRIPKPYMCNICSKGFRRNSELQDHIRVHTGEKPFECDVCTAAYGNKKSLRMHMKKHVPSKDVVCPVCSESVRETEFVEHSRMHAYEKADKSDDGKEALVQVEDQGKPEEKKPHVCETCQKCFSKKEDLEDHIRTCSCHEPFVCHICNASYYNSSELNNHMKMHDSNSKMSCKLCSKNFHSQQGLAQHVTGDTGEKPYVCEMCAADEHSESSFGCKASPVDSINLSTGSDLPGGNSEQLSSLMTEDGTVNVLQKNFTLNPAGRTGSEIRNRYKPYMCNICNKPFRRNSELQDHIRVHTGEKPFECHVCTVAYGSKRSLRMHMKKHVLSKDVVCHVCSESVGQSEFFEHFRTHASKKADKSDSGKEALVQVEDPGQLEEKKPHVCETCQKCFSEKEDFEVHIRTRSCHKPFVCHICNASYSKSKELNNHMKKHNSKKKKMSCELCSKKFHSLRGLAQHVTVHTGEKPYVCEICGRSFSYSEGLRTHMRRHLEGVKKPYKCEICIKSYVSKQNLEDHIRTHTGEKPFFCDICKTSYTSKVRLDAHTRRRHIRKKKHACDICAKKFLTLPELVKHLRVHTGEKPFECEECGSKFAQRCQRDSHVKTRHRKSADEPRSKTTSGNKDLGHRNTLNSVNDSEEQLADSTVSSATENVEGLTIDVSALVSQQQPLIIVMLPPP